MVNIELSLMPIQSVYLSMPRAQIQHSTTQHTQHHFEDLTAKLFEPTIERVEKFLCCPDLQVCTHAGMQFWPEHLRVSDRVRSLDLELSENFQNLHFVWTSYIFLQNKVRDDTQAQLLSCLLVLIE